jgi:hypothetical protein
MRRPCERIESRKKPHPGPALSTSLKTDWVDDYGSANVTVPGDDRAKVTVSSDFGQPTSPPSVTIVGLHDVSGAVRGQPEGSHRAAGERATGPISASPRQLGEPIIVKSDNDDSSNGMSPDDATKAFIQVLAARGDRWISEAEIVEDYRRLTLTRGWPPLTVEFLLDGLYRLGCKQEQAMFIPFPPNTEDASVASRSAIKRARKRRASED